MKTIGTILVAAFIALASFMVLLLPMTTHILADITVEGEAAVGAGVQADIETSSRSHEYLVKIAEDVLLFSLGDDGARLPLGTDDEIAMTQDIISHLIDVRIVFNAARIAFAVATFLLAAFIVFAVRKKRVAQLIWALKTGGVITATLLVILAIVGLTSFETLFAGMHKIFFAQGNWTFSSNSLLITALPQTFWIANAITWAAALIILSAASFITGLFIRRSSDNY